MGKTAFAGYSSSKSSVVPGAPNPFSDEDDVNRSYSQFSISRPSAPSQNTSSDNNRSDADDIIDAALRIGGVPDPRIDKDYPDTLLGYIESKFDDYFGIPEKVNPLTGTVRATGLPKALTAVMPLPMSALIAVAGYASQKNLENMFSEAKKGTPGYGVGLLNNQMVGYSPGMLSELGFGPVMSGMVDNVPPGLTAAQHQQNIIDALAAVDFTNLDTIPDITSAYNIASYGAVEGANIGMGSLASQGVVHSYSENPYGLGNIKTPVTSATTGNFITTLNSPWAGYGPSDLDFDPTFGYTDVQDVFGNPPTEYDDVGNVIDTSPDFDSELDVSDLASETPSDTYGDPSAPGGGEFGGNTGNTGTTGNTENTGTTGNTGSSSMGSNSGMSGPGDMGSSNDDNRDNDDGPGGGAADGSEADTGGGYGALGHAVGGRIGKAAGGGVTQGFLNKNPSTVRDDMSIADNRYTSVKSGSFVVNQPSNEKYKEKLDSIVADASKTAKMKKGGKVKMVDVALSDGERLIEPEVVAAIEKKHGKSFLDKINDEGKPEVKRRQAKYGEKIGAALGGGFLVDQGMERGDVGEDTPMEDYLPVSDELKARLSKFAAKKPQRGQIKQFIKSLSPEDKLTVLFLTETTSNADPIESMEAIGEVVKNRMNSDYYDFKGIKTLDDALLKQTSRGAFHFSGLEPKNFWPRTKDVKKGLANKGLAKAYAAAQNVLDPETEGASRLPANTVFYTRKDAPSQWMRESKKLEFSTELGGHEFYRTFAAPEFP
jgi:hypothetical protein